MPTSSDAGHLSLLGDQQGEVTGDSDWILAAQQDSGKASALEAWTGTDVKGETLKHSKVARVICHGHSHISCKLCQPITTAPCDLQASHTSYTYCHQMSTVPVHNH